jgi:hypothetical protein
MFALVEKIFHNGYYNIKLYSHKGECNLIHKITTDSLPYVFPYKNRKLVITRNQELKLIKE